MLNISEISHINKVLKILCDNNQLENKKNTIN